MDDLRVTIRVPGRPRPKGSRTAGIAYKGPHKPHNTLAEARPYPYSRPASGDKVAKWEKAVHYYALQAMGTRPPTAGPVSLAVDFYLSRPKAHYGTGRNAHALKDTAPRYHVIAPDADKLLRAVKDGLTGAVYRDDAQVVSSRVTKNLAPPWEGEGAVIVVQLVGVPANGILPGPEGEA